MKQTNINSIISKAANKSQAMQALYNEGLEIKEIAKLLDVRYNFVYNVISNYCIVNDLELRTTKSSENSKKSKIESLFNEGKSNVEIAKELKTNYNYVYKVTKELISR